MDESCHVSVPKSPLETMSNKVPATRRCTFTFRQFERKHEVVLFHLSCRTDLTVSARGALRGYTDTCSKVLCQVPGNSVQISRHGLISTSAQEQQPVACIKHAQQVYSKLYGNTNSIKSAEIARSDQLETSENVRELFSCEKNAST